MLRLIPSLVFIHILLLGCTNSAYTPSQHSTTTPTSTVSPIESHMDTGIRFMEDKDFNRAIEKFTMAIDDEPSNPQPYFHRAAAYLELEDPDKAERDYRKACELGLQDACTEANIMKDERDPMVQIAYALMDDALNLIPVTLRKKIAPDDNLDAAMRGAESFRNDTQLPTALLSEKDYGAVAAYTIKEIYGEDTINFYVPAAVYFNGMTKMGDLKKALTKAKAAVKASTMSARDRYNESLSLIVNLWVTGTPGIPSEEIKAVKEGVYLRDKDDKLYAYDEVIK